MPNSAWPDPGKYSEFFSPAAIVAGRGSSKEAANLLASRLGIADGTILVAVDDIVLAAGLAETLLDGLRAEGYDVVVTGGFGSEPASDVVDAAASIARESGARAIIGIGGGSVLDASKLLSLLVRNEGLSADWLGAVNPAAGVVPLLLIPTTCGTGSEATRIAMITVEGAKRASSCALYVPSAVILDPELVRSLPGPVAASTAMDALSHAVESLMSTTRSPMTTHNALRAIELLTANIEAAVSGDADALAQCLWGSHLAGQALNAGVVVGHSLAYCLAYEHPMPHGVSCALALPYCLAYNGQLDPELAHAIATALTRGASGDLRAAATAVMDLSRTLGLPTTLRELNIPADHASQIAARCITEYPRPTNPEPLTQPTLERLVNSMYDGDLSSAFDAVLIRASR